MKLYIFSLFSVLFFVANAQTLADVVWVNSAGGNATDLASSISVDSLGNTYSVGRFTPPANFGPNILTTLGLYVTKIDSDGNWVWSTSFGPFPNGIVEDVTNDLDGNVYITGRYVGFITFGSFGLNTSDGLGEIYVAKLDTDGNWLWATAPTGNCTGSSKTIKFDGTNLVIGGGFQETCTFGADTISVPSGYQLPLVAKLDTNGNFISANTATSIIGGANVLDLYINGPDVYVTGEFVGNISFSSINLSSSGFPNMFVAKLDGGGMWVWANSTKSIANNGGFGTFGIGITGIGNENVFVTGYCTGVVQFGPFVLNGYLTKLQLYVGALDVDGDWIWATLTDFKNENTTSPESLGFDIVTNGTDLFVSGLINGDYIFGNKNISLPYRTQIISSLDLNGNWTDIVVFNSSVVNLFNSKLAIYPGALYSTSSYTGTIQFSNFTLTSDSTEIYILKINLNSTAPPVPPKPPSKLLLIILLVLFVIVLLFVILVLIKIKCHKKCDECTEDKVCGKCDKHKRGCDKCTEKEKCDKHHKHQKHKKDDKKDKNTWEIEMSE